MRTEFLLGGAVLVLALTPATSAAQEESFGKVEITYSAAVLERAEEMSMREVLEEGLVIETSGFEEPQEVLLVGVVVRGGELLRSEVSDPFRLEPGTTAAGPGEPLGEYLSGVLKGVDVAHDEPLPTSHYATFERPLFVEQILPNTKDVKPLVQHCCVGEHVPAGELLFLYLTPANRESGEGVQTRPVMIETAGPDI